MPIPPKRDVLGVGISLATPLEIASGLRARIERRAPPVTVCSVNVHTFTEALRDPGYLRAMTGATITWIDGVPIRWMLRAGGEPMPPPRIHGSDFMELLIRELPEARHYFYGSTPETLALLESSLRA